MHSCTYDKFSIPKTKKNVLLQVSLKKVTIGIVSCVHVQIQVILLSFKNVGELWTSGLQSDRQESLVNDHKKRPRMRVMLGWNI